MTSLASRVAVITGGGSGIGRAICQVLAREGAHIAVVDLHKENAIDTAKSMPGKAEWFTADVSNSSSVNNLLQNIKQKFPQVPSIAVNCAGITKDAFLLKMDESSFDDVIDVNLKGTFLMTQAVSKLMVENDVKPGSIINISSIVGKGGNMGQCNYTASKAGVVGFTKTVAKELGQFGIRCNVILPGFIDTPMTQTVPEKVLQMMKTQIPVGRLGNPEDIAEACAFLASEKSSYVTGTSIEVTGGLLM